MFHSSDDTAFSRFTKQLVFWASLCAMFALFIFILTTDATLPQQKMTVEINIKDKINICAPEQVEVRQAFNHRNYDF